MVVLSVPKLVIRNIYGLFSLNKMTLEISMVILRFLKNAVRNIPEGLSL